MKYTASLATWYGGQWHLDPSTESAPADEQTAISIGHKIAFPGGLVLYIEYKANKPGRKMIEYQGHLEPASADMIA
jgi:hypothetical protein